MMKNKKIVILGGTGFIGRALGARWQAEDRVVVPGRLRFSHPTLEEALVSLKDGW